MVVISHLKKAAGLGSPQHHSDNHHRPFLKQALHAFPFQFHNKKHISQALAKSLVGLFLLRWSYLLLLATQGDTAPFLPSPYNYTLPVIPTKYTLPPPHLTQQPNVLIVLSARGNFQRRSVIRDTYAHGHDNIYFVIGGPEPNDTEDKNLTRPSSVSSQLFHEQSTYQDIIDTIHPDTYRGLPFKVHFALQFIAQKLPNINWVVKVDDDAVVRWQRLQFFLLSTLNADTPMVIGNVALNWMPHPTGKWAEDPKFVQLNKPYPPFCPGSAGYALSRPVVHNLASQPQYYYANEDVGVGIWLDESPLQVKWIWTQDMTSKGECEDRYHIIGHKLDANQIKECFETLGDQVPTTQKQIVSSFGHGKHEWKP